MDPHAALPTEERVREALRSVDDPEVGMNIVDLGLVYRIDIAPERVRVELTMTTPACPMGDLISENADRAVRAALPRGRGRRSGAGVGPAVDPRLDVGERKADASAGPADVSARKKHFL